MSQDGRDTSGKASPDRKDAPAGGDANDKTTEGKSGGGSDAKASPQAAKDAAAKDDAGKKPAGGSDAKSAKTAATDSKSAASAGKGTSTSAGKTASKRTSAGRSSAGSGRVAAVLWTLAVVAVGGGVAIATLPRWQPVWNQNIGNRFPALHIALGGGEGQSKLDQRLAHVESRLGDLSTLDQRSQQLSNQLDQAMKRITELEDGIKQVRSLAKQVAGQPASDATDALQSINHRLKALEGSAASESQLKQSMTAMQDRINQLEQQTAQAAKAAQANEAAQADSKALVLAVAQLRDTVRRGEPYASDLQALRKIAAGDDQILTALKSLDSHAQSGIPTLAALTQRFEAIAGGLVSAADAPQGAAWWQRALGKVEGLVSLRRKDAAAGGVEGAVAEAEHLLSDGDLKGAVDALQTVQPKLGPDAKSKLAPWLSDANARLEAERALAALHVKAISQLGSAG